MFGATLSRDAGQTVSASSVAARSRASHSRVLGPQLVDASAELLQARDLVRLQRRAELPCAKP